MGSQKSEPHQDFKVWVTIEPQNSSILPNYCCRLIYTPLPFPILIPGDAGSFAFRMANRALQLHESFQQWSIQRWERKFPLIRHCNLQAYSDHIQKHTICNRSELVKVWMFSFVTLVISELDK